MDLKLILCLAVAFIAVEADSPNPIGPICFIFCPNGIVPGTVCQCRPRPPPFNPCRFRQCGIRQRCVVIRRRAVCVPRFPIYGRCYQPRAPGRCRAYIPRYFYNSRTGRCQRFIYGGCGGNRNNFQTLQACRRACRGARGSRRGR